MKQKKHWYDYLWIASLTYLVLGFFNILFAWLGLLCFFIPLIISLVKGNKGYCNRYCGQAVTLLWTFRVPWHWAYHQTGLPPAAAQFAFGFYSVMLTSTILGLATMALFRPRSWCVYCPMGTMTQMICKAKAGACPGAASGCGTSGCSSLGCGASSCGASGYSSSGCSSSDCSSSCSDESLS